MDQQRTGSTKVTLGYTLGVWLQVHEADERTLEGYRGYAERTIKPALGDVSIANMILGGPSLVLGYRRS